MSVTTPPTATPVVSGTSKSTSSSWLRTIRRLTFPSAISSLVRSTSSATGNLDLLGKGMFVFRSGVVYSFGLFAHGSTPFSRRQVLLSAVIFAVLVLPSSPSRPVVENPRCAGSSYRTAGGGVEDQVGGGACGVSDGQHFPHPMLQSAAPPGVPRASAGPPSAVAGVRSRCSTEDRNGNPPALGRGCWFAAEK